MNPKDYARLSLRGLFRDLLDAIVNRYVPDVRPIVFDAERIREGNERAEAATVEYGPEHPNYRKAA